MEALYFAETLAQIPPEIKEKLFKLLNSTRAQQFFEKELGKKALTIEVLNWQLTLHNFNDYAALLDLLNITHSESFVS